MLSKLVQEGIIGENEFIGPNQAILSHPTITVTLPALIRKKDQMKVRLLGYKLDPHDKSDTTKKG